MTTKHHPELLRQLEQASGPIQVVVQLQMKQTSAGTLPSSNEIEQLARDVLQRATLEVGHLPGRTNVLRNLGTIVVEATPDFIQSLINQPEVASALPNCTDESAFIPPKGRRPA